MLEYAIWITQGLLTVAAACAIYRVFRGPSVLDRVISVDVILIVVASILLVDMVHRDHRDFILFVVITAVIGFLGAVAVARFVVGGRADAPTMEAERQHQEAALLAWGSEPQAPGTSPALSGAETGSVVSGAGEDRRASDAEEDESTSWFTALLRSGFVPGRTTRDPGEAGGSEDGSEDGSEEPPADEGKEQR